MANKDPKEKWTVESVTPVITDTVLATEGVASLQPMPPIHQGIIITNLFGSVGIDVYVNVFYNCNIPEVSWNVQERIKEAIEAGGMNADHINIHIEGVDLSNVRKNE